MRSCPRTLREHVLEIPRATHRCGGGRGKGTQRDKGRHEGRAGAIRRGEGAIEQRPSARRICAHRACRRCGEHWSDETRAIGRRARTATVPLLLCVRSLRSAAVTVSRLSSCEGQGRARQAVCDARTQRDPPWRFRSAATLTAAVAAFDAVHCAPPYRCPGCKSGHHSHMHLRNHLRSDDAACGVAERLRDCGQKCKNAAPDTTEKARRSTILFLRLQAVQRALHSSELKFSLRHV